MQHTRLPSNIIALAIIVIAPLLGSYTNAQDGENVVASGTNSQGTLFLELNFNYTEKSTDGLPDVLNSDVGAFVIIYADGVVQYGNTGTRSVNLSTWDSISKFAYDSPFSSKRLDLSDSSNGSYLNSELINARPPSAPPGTPMSRAPRGPANTCEYTSNSTGSRYICYDGFGRATYESRCTFSHTGGDYRSSCTTRHW